MLGEIADVNVASDEDASKESTDEVDNDSNISTNVTATPVSLIHNDINMDNILLGYRNGVEVPLINDFNIAVFRKKNARTGLPCSFHGRFANPQVSMHMNFVVLCGCCCLPQQLLHLWSKQWMSPEQQSRPEDELSTGKLNEKIDIYALGNIFYKIAVGNSPWKVSEQCSSLCVCYDAPLLISCTLSTVDSMITKSRKSPTTKRVKLPVPNYVEPSPRYRRKYETPPAP